MSKDEAIRTVMGMRDNHYGSDVSDQLEKEKNKLKELEDMLSEVNKKRIDASSVRLPGMAGLAINEALKAYGAETFNINPNIEGEIRRLEQQIKLQKEIVTQKKEQSALYSESVKYLNDQLLSLDKIEQKEKEITSVASTGEPIKIPVQIGSEKDLSEKISKLKERISNEVNPEIRFDLLREQDKLQKQLDKIRKENKTGD